MNPTSQTTPTSLHVIFDLVETQNMMKPRFIDGQEIPDWENGSDMAAYIHDLRKQGWKISRAAGGGAVTFTRSQDDGNTQAQ